MLDAPAGERSVPNHIGLPSAHGVSDRSGMRAGTTDDALRPEPVYDETLESTGTGQLGATPPPPAFPPTSTGAAPTSAPVFPPTPTGPASGEVL